MPEGIGAPLTALPADAHREDKSTGASCTIKLPNPGGSHTQIHIPSLEGGSSYTIALPSDGTEIRIDCVKDGSEGDDAQSSGQNLSDAKDKFYYAVFLRLLSYLTKGGYAQATGYRPGGLPAAYILLGFTLVAQVLTYVVARNYLFPLIKNLAGVEKDFDESSKDMLNGSLYVIISFVFYVIVSDISFRITKGYFKQDLFAVDCAVLESKVKCLVETPGVLERIRYYVLQHIDLKLLGNSGVISDLEFILYVHDYLKWGARSKDSDQCLLAGFALANLEKVLDENKAYVASSGQCSSRVDSAIRQFARSMLHYRVYCDETINELEYANNTKSLNWRGIEPQKLDAFSIRGVLNPGGFLPAYLLNKFKDRIKKLDVPVELLKSTIIDQLKHAFITNKLGHEDNFSVEDLVSTLQSRYLSKDQVSIDKLKEKNIYYNFIEYVNKKIVYTPPVGDRLVVDSPAYKLEQKTFLKQLLITTSEYIFEEKVKYWKSMDQNCCARVGDALITIKQGCASLSECCAGFWSTCWDRNQARLKKIDAIYKYTPLPGNAPV